MKQLGQKRGADKNTKNYFKDKLQGSASKNKSIHTKKIQEAAHKMAAYKTKQSPTIFWAPMAENHHKKRLLIQVEAGKLVLPNEKQLVDNIDFQIYFGDRIALSGKNGCGKTSLIKCLQNNTAPTTIRLEGKLYQADNLSIAFIDQLYNLVDEELSLVENIEAANPDLEYEQVRRQLGRFLFREHEEIHKLAKYLSGGELARLSLAMATACKLDLLVLDEPTNNLDLATKNTIAQALAQFPATILVISHDVDFLQQIGVEKSFCIRAKNFESAFLS